MVGVIDHEARHLLGFAHAESGSGPLDAVAAATVEGSPDFEQQGPQPREDGQASAYPDDEVSGAINAIVATSSNQIFVGTVNGGIWRTDNANAVDQSTLLDPKHVRWVPLTDQFPGLSISSLAAVPSNPNVLYAGIGAGPVSAGAGSFTVGSSSLGSGGALTGLLRSTDGGNSWQVLASQVPAVAPIVNVVSPSGGALQVGTYYLQYTYVDATGESTPSMESAQFTVANPGDVPQVTLPATPLGVTGVNIYLTPTNGAPGTESIRFTSYDLSSSPAAPGSPGPPAANSTLPVIGNPGSLNFGGNFNPAGGGVSSGSLAAGNYRLEHTWVGSAGETLPSPAYTFTVPAGSAAIPQVTVALPTGAKGVNFYLSPTNGIAGTEVLYAATAPTTISLSAPIPNPLPVSNTTAFGSPVADPPADPTTWVTATGGGTTGGSLAAGQYFVTYTWMNATGETLPLPTPAPVTVAAGNIPRVTLPALPAGATGANIYLRLPGGAAGSELRYATGVAGPTLDLRSAIPSPPKANTLATPVSGLVPNPGTGGLGRTIVVRIVPTGWDTALHNFGPIEKQIIAAATNQGVFLSTDGGVTWSNESARLGSGLPAGAVSDLVVDRGGRTYAEPTAFYAAVPGQGIYRAILVSNSAPAASDQVLRLPLKWLPMTSNVLNGQATPYSLTASTAITAATNASPIVITAAGHGLTSGLQVQISGVLGNTAANGTFKVTVINANNFSLDGSTGTGNYTTGGKVSLTSPVLTNVALTSRILLAIDTINHTLATALIQTADTGSQITGIYASYFASTALAADTNRDGAADLVNNTWKVWGIPDDGSGPVDPEGQTYQHGAIAFGPSSFAGGEPNLFVGGDTKEDETEGNLMFGRGAGWRSIVSYELFGPVLGRPHADTRQIVFGAYLYAATDGGIYRLNNYDLNPHLDGPAWASLNGNLLNAEFLSAAYDSNHNTVFGGLQDNATVEQPDEDELQWDMVLSGDGTIVQVAQREDTLGTYSVYFESGQNLGDFRRKFVRDGAPDTTDDVDLKVTGGGFNNAPLTTIDSTIQYATPYVLNAISSNRMLLGTSILYESYNDGDSLTPLGSMGGSPITALAYGGRSGGVANAEVAWVGAGATLNLRTTAGGPFSATAYAGGNIVDIAIDPDEWKKAYVIDNAGQVFMTADQGVNWRNITGDLSTYAGTLRTIEVVKPAATPGKEVVLIGAGASVNTGNAFLTGSGGVYRTFDPSSAPAGANVWTRYGKNLPNAIVSDLDYDKTDDLLLVATQGRGAWTLDNVGDSILKPGVLKIDGDTDAPNQSDVIVLRRNPNNPVMLDVFLNNGPPVLSVPAAVLSQIVVNGLGGDDTLTLDLANGNFIPNPDRS